MVINICMEIWFMMKLGFFIGKKKKSIIFLMEMVIYREIEGK